MLKPKKKGIVKKAGKVVKKATPKKKSFGEQIYQGFKDNFLFGASKKNGGSVSNMPTKKAFEIGGQVRNEGSMIEGLKNKNK